MKKLISDVGGMKTFVEIRKLDNPTNMRYVRVSTLYDAAKDPNGERTKFDMCLDNDEFETLKDFINEA
jgi:hypothetical protein